MQDGFLPQAQVNDEHVTHCQILEAFIQFRQQKGPPIPPDMMGILMQHGMQHVTLARADAQYMKAHRQEIEQFTSKFTDTMKAMQGQAAMQQKAQMTFANLRGGGPSPVAPPGLPQPGQPAGAGPVMPPGGLPVSPVNGSTPAL